MNVQEEPSSGFREILIYEDRFEDDNGNYILEGEGDYKIQNGKLYLSCAKTEMGLTLWLNREFESDLRISYEAMVIEPKLAGNINLFFMAKALNDEFVLCESHTGRYSEYHEKCKMYIMTFTGKFSGREAFDGWSRIRKNPGFNLLGENAEVFSEINKKYSIDVTKTGSVIECFINGEKVHSVEDAEHYKNGCIGFRTWKTNLWIANFRVFRRTNERL